MPKIMKNGQEYGMSPSGLSGLIDTNIQSPSQGEVLAVDSNGKWVNSTVVESGSNANGSYIKWSDGTMICTKSVTCSIPSNGWTAWGSCYDTVDKYGFGNFPQTYYATPKIMATITAGNAWLEGVWSTSTTSAGECRFIRPNDGAQKDITVDIIAIGRWKA